jgi:hypothetical protein
MGSMGDALDRWWARLRWRRRGAWQWPTFALLTVVDGALLAWLPFTGGDAEPVGALLVAGVLNLVVLAVAGPAFGWLLRRRRADLPSDVAADRAAVTAMLALTLALLAGGMAHRSAKQAHERQRGEAVARARRFAEAHAPAAFRPVTMRDVWDQGGGLWRTCFAGADPERDYCVFVRFDDGRPVVRADPDQRPNRVAAGPLAAGDISR